MPRMAQGKVIGGQHVNAVVSIGRRGDLTLLAPGNVAQAYGFKRPKLDAASVARWELAGTETRATGAAGVANVVGQAVAGAVLPGLIGKAAGAALGAAANKAAAPTYVVKVDWVDGKQSIIRLPEQLFQHFAVVLKDLEVVTEPAPSENASAPILTPVAQPGIMEQIAKLGALRDQGVLTEDEFSQKKADLLSRL